MSRRRRCNSDDTATPAPQGHQRFARQVAAELDGGVLRYSARVNLLRKARQHGIRRFDANLIIAVVQSRVQESGIRVQVGARKHSWKTSAICFLAVQGLILAGAGYILAS